MSGPGGPRSGKTSVPWCRHEKSQVIAALRGRLFAWGRSGGPLKCAPMDGSIKVEETKAVSGGAMPRRSLRNIGLLAICQALTQSSNTLMFASRSEEHTSELQSHHDLVCRLLLEKKNKIKYSDINIKKKKKT